MELWQSLYWLSFRSEMQLLGLAADAFDRSMVFGGTLVIYLYKRSDACTLVKDKDEITLKQSYWLKTRLWNCLFPFSPNQARLKRKRWFHSLIKNNIFFQEKWNLQSFLLCHSWWKVNPMKKHDGLVWCRISYHRRNVMFVVLDSGHALTKG